MSAEENPCVANHSRSSSHEPEFLKQAERIVEPRSHQESSTCGEPPHEQAERRPLRHVAPQVARRHRQLIQIGGEAQRSSCRDCAPHAVACMTGSTRWSDSPTAMVALLADRSASHVLLIGSWSPRFGDHRPDALVRGVGVDHHPVVGMAETVRPGGVGVHGGVVTRATGGVENRRPSSTGRIETAGGDHCQHTSIGFLTVFVVDVDQLLG